MAKERQYEVTIMVRTSAGDPAKWNWSDLLDDEAWVVSSREV